MTCAGQLVAGLPPGGCNATHSAGHRPNPLSVNGRSIYRPIHDCRATLAPNRVVADRVDPRWVRRGFSLTFVPVMGSCAALDPPAKLAEGTWPWQTSCST